MYKLFTLFFILYSLSSSAQHIQRVANINPSGSSFASGFTIFNDKIYFAASDSESRSQLWVTDGTEQGTTLIKSFCSGYNCNFPQILAILNDHLVFAAPYNNSWALWVTDGSPAGTQMIKEVQVATCCVQYKWVVINNKLYFTGNDGTSGNELWCTDGTTAGTYMVADIRPGYGGSDPQELCALNDKVYFAASDSIFSNFEPWVSDGTDTGTHMLKNVSPNGSSDPKGFFSYSNHLFFSARDDNNFAPYNTWISDGTTSGTHKFSTIATGNYDLHFVYNGRLYLALDSIYTTDGSDTGTHPFMNLNMGYPILFNNKLYFYGDKGNNNDELWTSDGTYAGTQLVKEIGPSLISSNIMKLTFFNNKLIFSATDATNGQEIWISDGTSAGTYKPQFPNANHTDPLTIYNRESFTEYNGELYFAAQYDTSGLELWKYNSAPAAINDLLQSHDTLSVIPNPATNYLQVSSAGNTDIIISDIIGHVVGRAKISGSKIIDISPYRPGIYFIRDGKGNYAKFAKE